MRVEAHMVRGNPVLGIGFSPAELLDGRFSGALLRSMSEAISGIGSGTEMFESVLVVVFIDGTEHSAACVDRAILAVRDVHARPARLALVNYPKDDRSIMAEVLGAPVFFDSIDEALGARRCDGPGPDCAGVTPPV